MGKFYIFVDIFISGSYSLYSIEKSLYSKYFYKFYPFSIPLPITLYFLKNNSIDQYAHYTYNNKEPMNESTRSGKTTT